MTGFNDNTYPTRDVAALLVALGAALDLAWGGVVYDASATLWIHGEGGAVIYEGRSVRGAMDAMHRLRRDQSKARRPLADAENAA